MQLITLITASNLFCCSLTAIACFINHSINLESTEGKENHRSGKEIRKMILLEALNNPFDPPNNTENMCLVLRCNLVPYFGQKENGTLLFQSIDKIFQR
jgi:hypothetical protein